MELLSGWKLPRDRKRKRGEEDVGYTKIKEARKRNSEAVRRKRVHSGRGRNASAYFER